MPQLSLAQGAPATVLRIGCDLVRDEKRLRRLCRHVGDHRARGAPVVIVHGGAGDDLDRGRRGGAVEPSPRARSGASLKEASLAGFVSMRLVAALTLSGIPAVGLSGLDLGGPELDERAQPGESGGLADAVRAHVEAGEVIVLAVSQGTGGGPPTPNALAGAIARELSASGLDLVVRPRQVFTATGAPLPRVSGDEARELLAQGHLLAETAPAVRAAAEAVNAGLERARIGNLRSLWRDEATVVERGPASDREGEG